MAQQVTANRVPAKELSDDDLRRELKHLHETRHETFVNGSGDALQAHTERMHELEDEYQRRFAAETKPDPLRTRAGSRKMDGRDA